jgi:hypothetical protein
MGIFHFFKRQNKNSSLFNEKILHGRYGTGLHEENDSLVMRGLGNIIELLGFDDVIRELILDEITDHLLEFEDPVLSEIGTDNVLRAFFKELLTRVAAIDLHFGVLFHCSSIY